MSHPDPNGPAATLPWRVGDELWNPVTRERFGAPGIPAGQRSGGDDRARGIAGPGRAPAPWVDRALYGARGHADGPPGREDEKLRTGETSEVRAGQWHDMWNAEDHDARVIVEVEPGERFAHMLETLFGLAEMGFVDAKGMPNLLQMSLIGREFADTVQFKSPPPAVQKVVFGLMAPLAHALGYRATYPQLSRSLLVRDPAEGLAL